MRYLAKITVFALSLLVLLAACKTDKGTNSDRPLYTIMPLAIGNSWTYELRDSVEGDPALIDTLYLVVVSDTSISGHTWYTFNQSIPLGGLPTGLVSSRSDGVYARVDNSEYLLMKYPAIEGESWAPVSVCDIEVTADMVISVPAGSYRALTYTIACSGFTDTVDASAALDVGIVSMQHRKPYDAERGRVIDYRLINFSVD